MAFLVSTSLKFSFLDPIHDCLMQRLYQPITRKLDTLRKASSLYFFAKNKPSAWEL